MNCTLKNLLFLGRCTMFKYMWKTMAMAAIGGESVTFAEVDTLGLPNLTYG